MFGQHSQTQILTEPHKHSCPLRLQLWIPLLPSANANISKFIKKMPWTYFLDFISLTPNITVAGNSIHYNEGHTAMIYSSWLMGLISLCHCWCFPSMALGGLTEVFHVLCLPEGSGYGPRSPAGSPGSPAVRGAASCSGWWRMARTTLIRSRGFPFLSQEWSQAFKTR